MDVIIIGAGIAGATAALNLAPMHRIAIVEAKVEPSPRIGESMPGASRRLLTDMGLLDGFLMDGHMPRQALESRWGNSRSDTRYAISDPDGPGWQIDRVRFERQLRREAINRGAKLLAPAKVVNLKRHGAQWNVTIVSPMGFAEVRASIVLDASGRASHASMLPGRREYQGRLICFWARAENVQLPCGVVQIEAEQDGWWYAAPLTDGNAILAFHTDADLPAARFVRTREGLLSRVRKIEKLAPLFDDRQWDTAAFGICAADGVRRKQASGPGWMAVGDAAIAFDPIAAQGLFNALYLGLASAEACSRALAADRAALPDYATEVDAIWARYSAARAAWYSLEMRWPDHQFWSRRHISSPSQHSDNGLP